VELEIAIIDLLSSIPHGSLKAFDPNWLDVVVSEHKSSGYSSAEADDAIWRIGEEGN
jgi:hypothetical protein